MRLVGRAQETAALRGLLDRAAAGQGGLVLVCGEPGIGKRSLLADLTGYARSSGAVVLAGRAVPGSGPYRAVSDALLPFVRAGRVRETPELRPFGGALSRILPGWATPGPAEIGIDPVLLLGEGVLRLLLTLPASVRVLVLENLEDADPDTLALLDYLTPAVAGQPVLLVGSQTAPRRPPWTVCRRPGCGRPGSPTPRRRRWWMDCVGCRQRCAAQSCSARRACRWWPPP